MLGKILGVFGILITTQFVMAHGMDKLGPNKGYIRMPGAFHTELVQSGREVKVWLLDVNLKDPLTHESSVLLTVQRGEVNLQTEECKVEQNYFKCSLATAGELQKGDKLVVKANRGPAKGGDAIYKYPFTLKGH